MTNLSDKELRMKCVELVAESLRGTSMGTVVRGADMVKKYIEEGTVPEKPETKPVNKEPVINFGGRD